MTKFQNMKIEINEQQPLDEIIKELERLGYKLSYTTKFHEFTVLTNKHGWIDVTMNRYDPDTTLAQLKAMEK